MIVTARRVPAIAMGIFPIIGCGLKNTSLNTSKAIKKMKRATIILMVFSMIKRDFFAPSVSLQEIIIPEKTSEETRISVPE